jgi:hypothetical protein
MAWASEGIMEGTVGSAQRGPTRKDWVAIASLGAAIMSDLIILFGFLSLAILSATTKVPQNGDASLQMVADRFLPYWVSAGVLGIAAVFCGWVSLGRIRGSNGTLAGKWLAISGMLLGVLALIAPLGALVLLVLFFGGGHVQPFVYML